MKFIIPVVIMFVLASAVIALEEQPTIKIGEKVYSDKKAVGKFDLGQPERKVPEAILRKNLKATVKAGNKPIGPSVEFKQIHEVTKLNIGGVVKNGAIVSKNAPVNPVKALPIATEVKKVRKSDPKLSNSKISVTSSQFKDQRSAFTPKKRTIIKKIVSEEQQTSTISG